MNLITKGGKIDGRYEIIKTIGDGGMATVYLAYDTVLDRNVAVKVLRGDLASDEKFVRRFRREAMNASKMSHPNIVKIHDVGVEDGQYYIVMEYVEGKTLKQLIKKRGHLTRTEVIDIMLQLTEAMAHAHDRFVIHRDIKPQNIMILENGIIKITDFGIAQALNSTELTQTNSVMGTVHYLPPEQANGKGSTIRSDIYSMGVLMYELLTGSVPYKGDSAVEIALKHLKEPFPSVKDKIPDTPNSIENIIIRATAKNPENRYSSSLEMYEDLKTALDESRKDEPRYVYKYPETDLEQTKKLERISDVTEATKKGKTKSKKNFDEEIWVEEIKEDKKQNKLLIILLTVFAFLVAITASILVIAPKFSETKDVTIPNIVNMSEEKASEVLEGKGFKVLTDNLGEPSETVEIGRVVKTSPAIGRKAKEGSTVTLYLSTGSEFVVLENYVGRNFTEVVNELENDYNIKIDAQEQAVEKKKYKKNTIVAQSPLEGEKVRYGGTVTLYKGVLEVTYPNFTSGYTIKEVQKFCSDNGVTLDIAYLQTDEYDEGTIIKQSRPEGTTVLDSSTLTITIAATPVDDEPTSEDVTEPTEEEVEEENNEEE